MSSPSTLRFLPAALLVLAGVLTLASLPSLAEQADTGTVEGSSPSVERGRYIANELAMCVQCHSPRDRRGELRQDSLFLGAPLPVKSPFPMSPRWAFTAPNLRNVPGYTEEEFLHFLTTGIRPNGTEARGPMPPFRMTQEDAKAVYDYLMSL